jgi:ribonuclease D
MIARLFDAPVVAVDTESDSLHVYFEKVCLLQFSIPGADYLVDPLRVDVQSLRDLFASQDQEKVFHAAEYDIMCLRRDYGFTFVKLFDTMIAARVLGWKHLGLGPILEERLNVRLNKRLQRYNWGVRPLTDMALEYARGDTHYLLPLRDLQLEELTVRNRLVEARQAFQRQARIEPNSKVFDPNNFWHISGSRELSPDQQAVLRQLYMWRDHLAREIDLPPFKVVGDATLLRLARVCPTSRRALARVKGLSQRIHRRYADDLLKAIAQGRRSPPPALPNHSRPQLNNGAAARYQALRSWRKGVAEARQVEPDVILSNHTLMQLAQQSPATAEALARIEALDDWQRQTYGADLLQVLKDHR